MYLFNIKRNHYTYTYNVNIYEGVYVLILCFTHSYQYLFDNLLN